MAFAERPEFEPTWEAIRLNDLLSRLSTQLDTTATIIARVEASLGILIRDARGLSPELIRDLQEIDLARQSICDVGRVLRLAAAHNTTTTVTSAAVASVIHLRDVAAHLLSDRSSQRQNPAADQDSISWF